MEWGFVWTLEDEGVEWSGREGVVMRKWMSESRGEESGVTRNYVRKNLTTATTTNNSNFFPPTKN